MENLQYLYKERLSLDSKSNFSFTLTLTLIKIDLQIKIENRLKWRKDLNWQAKTFKAIK